MVVRLKLNLHRLKRGGIQEKYRALVRSKLKPPSAEARWYQRPRTAWSPTFNYARPLCLVQRTVFQKTVDMFKKVYKVHRTFRDLTTKGLRFQFIYSRKILSSTIAIIVRMDPNMVRYA